MRRAASFFRPTPKTEPDVWAAANRVYPPTAGVPGPRDPGLTPYAVPFARAIHSGRFRRVVMVTGAQSGKTETLLDVIGARLDQRPAPIVYAGPTKEFVTDQFEPRVMELLDQASTLKGKVLRGKRMKKTLKWVSGVPLRLVHAGSSTALKSYPAALALVDEYDEMLRNVKGQGSPLELIEARGATYADFVTAVVSTTSLGVVETEIDRVSGLELWRPGDPDEIESPIWRLWQEGTRYHWAWPCPECGEFFVPRMKYLRWPERATPAQARRATVLVCPHCGAALEDDKHKAAMNERGVPVGPGQVVDRSGVVHGAPPDTSTWSLWVSGLASPFVSWGERVEALLTARASGDPDKIQTATNAGFGELFAPGGGEVPEWQEVMRHRLPYRRGEVPYGVQRVFAGIDVQKNSIFFVVRGFGDRGSSWLLDFGQLYGPTDEDQIWTDLANYLVTPIGEFLIERAYIDSGFRPDKPQAGDEHKVYAFARRFQWLVRPVKGRAVMRGPFNVSPIEVKPSGKKRPYTIELVNANTDFFKSLVHSRIRTPMDIPGFFAVPEDVTEDYARQLVSEARTIVNGKPAWVLRARANHFFDCEALVALAAHAANVDRLPGLPPPGAEDQEDDDPPSAPTIGRVETTVPVVAIAQAPTASIRQRFARASSLFNR